MNYNKEVFQRNRLLQKIRQSNRSGSHKGCIRIFSNNSLEHEETKLKVAYKLKKQGFEIWSEVIFNNGSRADLLAIKEGKGYIIEILHSETKKQLAEKVKKYPSEFELISVTTKDFNLEEFEV